MNSRRINVLYIFLQGLFWMLFCVSAGFISFYLQGLGFSDSKIGIWTAIFSLITVFLQPFLGNLSDRFSFLTWKRMMIFLLIQFWIVSLLMLQIKNQWMSALLFALLYILINACIPFTNSAAFFYARKGVVINFGIARGVGSLSFALMALIIGNLSTVFGRIIIPLCGIMLSTLLLIVIQILPCDSKEETVCSQSTTQINAITFLIKYKTFSLMLISVIFMYFSHNMIGIYLLQIIQSLGGNSADLGRTLSLQAIVEIPILFTFSLIMRRVKTGRLMVISSIGYLLKAVMYLLSGNIMMIYVTQLFQMCSFAILVAASVYFTAITVDKEDQTTGQAFMTSMMAAGTVLGSFFGGWILEMFSISILLMINMVIAVIGVLFAMISVGTMKEDESDIL